MLPLAFITAGLLLIVIVLVMLRALAYVDRHPELLTNASPVAYQQCHETLADVIARYHALSGDVVDRPVMAWQSPNGLVYVLTEHGVEERRSPEDYTGAYRLNWRDIGGIGLRMQPGFKFADRDGDRGVDVQYTIGYSFFLLVVPVSGKTMNIAMPTHDNRVDAVNFAAHILTLAEREGKRINVFGFNRPPAPHRQKIPKV